MNPWQHLAIFLTDIRWSEMFYVIFGAILGWLFAVGKDVLIKRKEALEILVALHKEIQFYRNNFCSPGMSSKDNSINMWPEISPSFTRLALERGVVSLRQRDELFTYCVELIRDIEFYHRVMDAAYMGFVSRFCNQSDVFSALSRPLNMIRVNLRKLDLLLAKRTKVASLEIPLDEFFTSHQSIAASSSTEANLSKPEGPGKGD